jgi:2-(1,2-epoxy-1,2-dihydrophenyl)acetyl-CoA isomerase
MNYDELIEEARADQRELVTVEHLGDRAIVRMTEPTNLNALSAPLTLQLQDALARLSPDPEIRTIVLTGQDPGFCAGGDIELMSSVQA